MRHRAIPKVHSLQRRIRITAVPAGLAALACLAIACLSLWAPGAAHAGEAGAKAAKTPTGMQLARIELGRRLFFEPLASPSGKRSCASCHDPEHGFSDPKRVSVDDFGTTRRHSQAILDTAHNPTAHWDGEFKNVEELVKARLTATPLTGGYGRGGRSRPPALTVTSLGDHTAVAARREEMVLQLRQLMRAAAQAEAASDQKADGEQPKSTEARTIQLMLEFVQKARGGKAAAGSFFTKRGGALGGPNGVSHQLQQSGRYARAFKHAFGTEAVSLDRIATALSAYCKTIVSTEAPVDRHRAGAAEALSDSARRGLALFEGRAGCADCHASKGERPLFTDYEFHNTGVAWDDFQKGHFDESKVAFAALLKSDAVKEKLAQLGTKLDGKLADILGDRGRLGVSDAGDGRRAFKTPTLRDVARRGPYMHNGRFESLEQVVRYYAAGCGADEQKDKRLKGFEASDQDVTDLVAFLESLSGDERPGLASTAWNRRAKQTRLRFVDHEGQPLAGLKVGVQPAGDVLPVEGAEGGSSREMDVDEDGWLSFAALPTTHARVILPEALLPVGGDMVPDTCEETTVQLPVKGRMSVVLTLPKGKTAPHEVLVQHHPAGSKFISGFTFNTEDGGQQKAMQKAVRIMLSSRGLVSIDPTRFKRTSVRTVEGHEVASYEGWVRSDVGENATLLVPDKEARGGQLHSGPLMLAKGTVVKLALSKQTLPKQAPPK